MLRCVEAAAKYEEGKLWRIGESWGKEGRAIRSYGERDATERGEDKKGYLGGRWHRFLCFS